MPAGTLQGPGQYVIMTESEEKRESHIPVTPQEDATSSQTVNTDFMKEKIKQRPVNKKRLLRRTMITAFLAVLFGAIACAVFLGLEPVINNALNPQEEPAPVEFPSESSTDEMSPEDMIADDQEIVQQVVNEQTQASAKESSALKNEVTADVLQKLQGTQGYREQYDALSEVAMSAAASMVTVTGITSDYDWAGDTFQNSSDRSSGMIVADNSERLFILAEGNELQHAESIQITFADGFEQRGILQASDQISNLVIITVNKEDLTPETIEAIRPAKLGSSARSDLLGKPVIAVGSPSGTQGSVSYGVVTNAALPIDVTDSVFQRMTSDIYGSTKASGALVDTNGSVIGWIDMSHNSSDSANLISAIGITELKSLIEKMSNAQQIAFLGLHGTDVPQKIHDELGVPMGAYVTSTEMDSPAMSGGIQSGDVITVYDNKEVTSFADLVVYFRETLPNRSITVTVMRQSGDDYEALTRQITTGGRLKFMN